METSHMLFIIEWANAIVKPTWQVHCIKDADINIDGFCLLLIATNLELKVHKED